MVFGGKAIRGNLRKPTRVRKVGRGRRNSRARNAAASAGVATAATVGGRAAAFPLLSPPEEFGGDEQEEMVVAERLADEKAKVAEVEKVMAVDGDNGITESIEGEHEEQEKQEEQWPPPTQQQQQQDQQQLQSLEPPSLKPPPPAWSPPAPAEFENASSVSRGRLWGQKGWSEGLDLKLNFDSNLSCSVGVSDAEPIGLWAKAGIGTR